MYVLVTAHLFLFALLLQHFTNTINSSSNNKIYCFCLSEVMFKVVKLPWNRLVPVLFCVATAINSCSINNIFLSKVKQNKSSYYYMATSKSLYPEDFPLVQNLKQCCASGTGVFLNPRLAFLADFNTFWSDFKNSTKKSEAWPLGPCSQTRVQSLLTA